MWLFHLLFSSMFLYHICIFFWLFIGCLFIHPFCFFLSPAASGALEHQVRELWRSSQQVRRTGCCRSFPEGLSDRFTHIHPFISRHVHGFITILHNTAADDDYNCYNSLFFFRSVIKMLISRSFSTPSMPSRPKYVSVKKKLKKHTYLNSFDLW